ncbi:HlyC/CorC family transporter [Dongia sedimenti]|uniref:HlyC/CorC family transporter n=1 Tax=Dongia sedimenti TaxID=3064282 RepID=A0ABU0YMQ7_9PROT|nr:HlyC/CorC family transporter [Rhodospirillaceae bacterium R-7]
MDNTMIIYIIGLLLLLMSSGFFSGSETALTAVSRARMQALISQGNKRAIRVGKLHQKMEKVISTVLLGNTLVNALTAVLMSTLLTNTFGDTGAMSAVGAITATAFLYIFSEVLPKTFAINNADRFSLAVAPMVQFFVNLTYPITHVTHLICSGFLRLFGLKIVNHLGAEERMEELRGAIQLHAGSVEEIQDTGQMLHSILDLDDVPVSDIMVHRRNMTMLDADLPIEEIVNQALSSPHTRIPIYRGDPDNVVGVLHAKALLRALHANQWKFEGLDIVALAGKPWFIPDSTDLLAQLEAFRSRHEHFAIVVDEYGALMGIVTLEDILEEIVGDISDEHDIKVTGVTSEADGSYVMDGTVTIRDLNREFGWQLPDEHASTIAGLVLYEARRIPMVGQIFVFYGFRFEILDRRRNQITRVRLTPPDSETKKGDAATATPDAASNSETMVSVRIEPKKPGGGTTGAAA